MAAAVKRVLGVANDEAVENCSILRSKFSVAKQTGWLMDNLHLSKSYVATRQAVG